MSAGRIPQAFIDEVLLRTDIVDLIDARVKLKRAGKNYAACCPFHQEKSPSFTVNREKQFYYCFGCGASGNALSFLMEHDRLEFIDGLKQQQLEQLQALLRAQADDWRFFHQRRINDARRDPRRAEAGAGAAFRIARQRSMNRARAPKA